MCGICGLLAGASEIPAGLLRRMNGALVHRGPDDEGYYEAPGAGLAARRLSIIDLPGGRQPIGNEDGTVWLAYNGEVYNHAELRAELEGRGHVFRTRTDTETIVHAYEEWGEACVARLRGMFAFALWDAPRARLLLARDRFGIKPLYYAQAGETFAFASELRPILAALPILPRRADPQALWDLFGLGFVPSPLTLFSGVRKLPAAHFMLVERGEGRPRIALLQRYWQPDFPAAGNHHALDEGEAAEAFAARLREAVDAWKLSDVPVGALLSGGIDSAAVAVLLQETLGAKISTFSIGFTAAAHDEAERARATARFLGSDHHELLFTPAAFDHLPQIVRRMEEPQCSATTVPLFLLYRACHQAGFKVILTGEGADELLGGYHWFVGDARLRLWRRLPPSARALLARAPLPTTLAARRVLAQGGDEPVARFALWQTAAGEAERQALFANPAHGAAAGRVVEQWQAEFAGALAGRAPFEQFVFLDSRTRLVDFINFTVDRMSMAFSVEARLPFLDHLLWEFTAALPASHKIKVGFLPGRTAGNKLLLRRGMAGCLPPELLRRPKLGLAAPHAAWWRAERLPAWAEQAVAPAALRETGYFDPAEFARVRRRHQAGQADTSRLLTGVLTTQLWHDEFAR